MSNETRAHLSLASALLCFGAAFLLLTAKDNIPRYIVGLVILGLGVLLSWLAGWGEHAP